jgi:uncharacterized protein (DUF3084 family)
MLPFVLQIVLLLTIIGGAVAYIGNYLGRRIGKRRLSIFGLRPRYTAVIITIISGILISLSTLLIVLVISQDARTALLGMEALKQQIRRESSELQIVRSEYIKLSQQQAELEKSLNISRAEVAELTRTREKLARTVEVARKGNLLFKIDEPISISLIQAGRDKAKLEEGLKGILSAADVYVRSFGIKNKENLIFMPPENFESAVAELQGENIIYIVKLVADRNVMWGEVIPARFEITENRLVYKKDEEIAARNISAGMDVSRIEQAIMQLLSAAHQAARTTGMIPDHSGSVGSIPYAEISELARKIKTNNKNLVAKALAEKDIYLIGPLEVKFKISYQ